MVRTGTLEPAGGGRSGPQRDGRTEVRHGFALWVRDPVASAVAFHLLTRLATLAAIGIAAGRQGTSFADAVTRHDGRWFERVAMTGYPSPLPEVAARVVTNESAFFPLFPLLVRPLVLLGVPFWLGAVLEVLIFSTVTSALIVLCVRRYASDRVALLTSCCWSVFPTASVLSVAYSEALFSLTVAACLLFLLRRSWLAAGVAAALGGATRPTGLVLVAALGVVVLVALVRDRDRRSLLALAIAPLGTLAALGGIGLATGRMDAWFVTQREGWGVYFDGGVSFVRWVWDSAVNRESPVRIAFVVAVVGCLALVVLALLRRPPLPVALVLAAGTILAVGQGGEFYLSPLRFLLPFFPLLVPAAEWLSGRKPLLRAVVLAGLGVIAVAGGVYYFAATGGASP